MPLISLQIAFPISDPANGSQLAFGVALPSGVSKIVSGVRAVEQHFAKLMLTLVGTNPFDFDSGSLLSEIGKEKVTSDNILSLKNDMALSVLSVQTQILNSQDGLDLDPSETLVSAEVTTLEFTEGLGWEIVVLLTMLDGNTIQSILGA